MSTEVVGQIESISLEAVVTRADGTTEDLGTIAEYHRDEKKSLAARLKGLGTIKLGKE